MQDHALDQAAPLPEARIRALVLALAQRCIDAQTRIATVESCTGGLLAVLCTDLSGSSAWFERGWVTYSNEAKIDQVGVGVDTLRAYGAVSEPTAKEMAAGGLIRSQAHVCVAITGIAGPTGGSAEKPVGTVCFGLARRGAEVTTQTAHFSGDRTAVRFAACQRALELLLHAV